MQSSAKKVKKPAVFVGVDEAGRGPLAGPVCVGIVAVPAERFARFKRAFAGVRDSKKLTPAAREAWASVARAEMRNGNISFCASFSSNAVIDKQGIVPAVNAAMRRALRRLGIPHSARVLLDGALRAPAEFPDQRTIIRGDETVPLISLASIVAKVRRDRYMAKLAKLYPAYGFEIHKGYGTKLHADSLRRLGPCELHRKSFIRNFEFAQ